MSEFARAAFRPLDEAVAVELDGDTYSFRALSAEGWLSVLGSGDWVVNLLGAYAVGSAYRAMLDRVAEGDSPPDTPVRLARAALADAAGRPWWEAERLASASLTPSTLGHVLGRGVQPYMLTLAAFLATVEAALLASLDDTKRLQFEAEITMPPPEALGEVAEEDPVAVMQRLRGMTGVRIG